MLLALDAATAVMRQKTAGPQRNRVTVILLPVRADVPVGLPVALIVGRVIVGVLVAKSKVKPAAKRALEVNVICWPEAAPTDSAPVEVTTGVVTDVLAVKLVTEGVADKLRVVDPPSATEPPPVRLVPAVTVMDEF